jgi:flavin reductase (DIM6/NTAB) family NADH-FMN oxidoreductase RutF
MERSEIAPRELVLPPFAAWEPGWFLLTAGEWRGEESRRTGKQESTKAPSPQPSPSEGRGGQNPASFNCMTVSWGALGVLWSRPLVVVVVRPHRHTYQYMESSDSFSLCAFPEQYREVLNMLCTKSGRDIDKVKESGLTPIALAKINSPGFAEAELILECRKTYFDDLNPEHFLADYIPPLYRGDYHRMYFGEVVAVQGVPTYRAWRARKADDGGTDAE